MRRGIFRDHADLDETGPRTRAQLGVIVGLVLAVLLGAELVIRLVSPVLPEPSVWYSGWAEAKADLVVETASPDIVILGDSSSMNAIDPAAVTLATTCYESAFNAGLPGVNLAALDDWYRRVFEPRWSPDLLILAITSRTMNPRAPAPYFDSLAVQVGLLNEIHEGLHDVSYLIRYRSVLRDPVQLLAHFGNEPGTSWRDLGPNGWVVPKSFTYRAFPPDEGPARDYESDGQEGEEALKSLLHETSSTGVPVAIAWLPVTEDWRSAFEDGRVSHEDIKTRVTAIASRASAPVIDLDVISDVALYNDPLHVNSAGAQVVSKNLGEQLDDIGCFPG